MFLEWTGLKDSQGVSGEDMGSHNSAQVSILGGQQCHHSSGDPGTAVSVGGNLEFRVGPGKCEILCGEGVSGRVLESGSSMYRKRGALGDELVGEQGLPRVWCLCCLSPFH